MKQVDEFLHGTTAQQRQAERGFGERLKLFVKVLSQRCKCLAAGVPRIAMAEGDNRTYFFMAGSFGDLCPDFVGQIVGAMHGREDTRPKETGWETVTLVQCLWPSRMTAQRMSPCGVIYTLRAIPMKVWNAIPTDTKDRC